MQKSNLFLKYRSKSEKNYYELTDLFDLKPLDVLVMQYLMKMFKKSTSHGKNGKDGKCFYRDDKKFTGFYYGGHYKDMAKHVHAKVNTKSLKRSINRLQSKGLLYHHKSYNHVQIFFPIFDSDVRTSFKDPNYKTVINFSEIDKGNPTTSAKDKMSFAQRTKRALRKCQNVLCRNVPVNNVPKNNVPSTNVVQHKTNKSTARQKLPKWINKNLNQSISKALLKNVKDVPKVATKIIDVIFEVNRACININGSDYYKCSTNPYIQKGNLLKDLGSVFVFNAPLEDTVKTGYIDYIKENSNLKFKTKKTDPNAKLYANFNKSTYESNCDYYRKLMDKYKNTDKYNDVKKKFNKWVDLACINTDLTRAYIPGTKEYKNDSELHPTSAKLQAKCRAGLAKIGA